MGFDALRSWLTAGHALPLVGFALIAAAAAAFASKQLSGFRTYELLRYLETEDCAANQAIVMQVIKPLAASLWWLDPGNADLVDVACEVSKLYDALNAAIGRVDDETRSFLYSNWADSIVGAHDALAGFIEHRRRDPKLASAYRGFSELAAAVRSYAVRAP